MYSIKLFWLNTVSVFYNFNDRKDNLIDFDVISLLFFNPSSEIRNIVLKGIADKKSTKK